MKVGIRQKALMEALEKGATAATSDIAQTDTSNLALLIKSVKITADSKNLTIESGTNLMSVKYNVPVSDENGIVVKEDGCILVPAKELMNWIKVQGKESTITMTLQKLATPEIINTLDGVSDSDEESKKFTIKKIGTVKIASKDTAKTNAKWELDCYDPEEISSISYTQKAEKNFEVKGSQLIEGLGRVLFAALPSDFQQYLNGVSIQVHEKNLYFITTDLQRCALYKVPSADVSNIESEKPLLIPATLLEQCSKIIDKEDKLTFSYSEELDKVYITQPNLKIRLVSSEKQTIQKFPSVQNLLKKKYESLTELPKNMLNSLLINAAVVNSSCALFSFSKDDKTLTVKAISEANKYKPSVKQSELGAISKDTRVVWGVSHIMDGLKVMKEDDVVIDMPENIKSARFSGKGNESFIYFTMAPENKLYSSDMAE